MLSLLSDFKRELLTTILDEGTSKMPIKRVQLNQNLIKPVPITYRILNDWNAIFT